MKNLRVSIKLLVTFGVLIILMIATAFISVFGIYGVSGNLSTIYNTGFMGTSMIGTIEVQIEEISRNTLAALITDAASEKNAYMDKAMELANELDKNIEILSTQHGAENLEALMSACRTLVENMPIAAEEIKLRTTANGIESYNDYIAEPIDRCVQEANAAVQTISADTLNIFNSSNSFGRVFCLIILIIDLVSIVLCIVGAVYLTKLFTGAVKEIKNAVVDISNGKLHCEVKYQSKDEFGEMADAMRLTIERLSMIIHDTTRMYGELANGNLDVHTNVREAYVGEFKPLLDNMRVLSTDLSSTMAQIFQSAGQVDSGSEQVSAGAQANARGATEQAESIGELAENIGEISDKINKNAADSEEASRRITEVGKQAEDSNARMKEMLDAMAEISETSAKISEIIKTIEDIAFQTNILALNAAVEAARAGEAGKGFAVVADEVRNLANNSAVASQNTSELIQRSINAVENGSRIADETAESLSGVVNQIGEIVSTINRISSASDEQAKFIAQVTSGIDRISNVVQTNSATAEQSAAASEELSAQAAAMKVLVSRFTLRVAQV